MFSFSKLKNERERTAHELVEKGVWRNSLSLPESQEDNLSLKTVKRVVDSLICGSFMVDEVTKDTELAETTICP